ncbi:MAG: 50S ribosomal protein L6 [Spirochaetales bacterium]|nr:50S ribosomal protein L6 [Spirochaetales bacterium]
MSRIGRLPVEVKQDNIKVTIENNTITLESSGGKLSQRYEEEVEITYEKPYIYISRKNETKRAKSMHGLYRNLIRNMMIGVTEGFTRVLQIIGVGYKAELKGNILVLNLGYANPIEYTIPDGITCRVEANTKLVLQGIDKQKLGKACAEIRAFRPPEPYKGKGIRYENEYVRKKVGKTGVK